MPVNSSDPRVLRSMNMMLDAACDLIETRGLSAISITDIATKAGVTRPTFYHHFKDIRDLAQRVALARVQLDLPYALPLWDEQVSKLSAAARLVHASERAEPILRYLQAHHRFYLTVFDEAGDLCFFAKMANFLSKRIFDLSLDEPNGDPAAIEAHDRARFMTHGMLWTVITWLESDFSGANDVRAMAQRLASVIVGPSTAGP